MTFYELIKRVYWALDEWIASSLGLGDYYGADAEDDEADDTSDNNEDDKAVDEDHEVQVDEVVDEDDGYDDMYKYHDHQA
jgi:hypothetical protein